MICYTILYDMISDIGYVVLRVSRIAAVVVVAGVVAITEVVVAIDVAGSAARMTAVEASLRHDDRRHHDGRRPRWAIARCADTLYIIETARNKKGMHIAHVF